MANLKYTKIFKYVIIGGAVGSAVLSLHRNQYEVNSIGLVRFSRAACTVLDISRIYKNELYSRNLDKKSEEYKSIKSFCHQQGAERLLKLCCSNKGVYIKVGQHIAALEYLLPKEYVQTMKVLHSHAPTSNIADIYRVIREDLKRDVS